MVFSSSFFLFYFLPIFLLVYHLVPKAFRNYFILLASVVFYTWGAPKFVGILLGSTIVDYYLVNWMHRTQKLLRKKWLLGISISLNVGLLLYFKYANFAVENTNLLLQSLGIQQLEWVPVLLPIGISFYTFQTLTYSLDIYRGVHAPLKRVSDYLLYIMSFPQMIAGPIVRFNDIADQIIERRETIDDKLLGFFRFCIGLGKKVLIANALGQQADLIFAYTPEDITTPMAWIGILAYTFQIYFDFSGYSDMAIGLGRMMGFTFPENFNSPYTSGSISEFWRRWHITLGSWMRDYLYIPLGGNRVDSKLRLYFNLWFVFLVSGFWHGASWNFLIWGAFHGLFLILDRLFLLNILKRIGKLPAAFFTFFVVIIGWVFFRIEDFSDATGFLSVLFGSGAEINPSDFTYIPGLSFFMALAAFFSFFGELQLGKIIQGKLLFSNGISLKGYGFWLSTSVVILILCSAFLAANTFNPFIYFRF